MRILFGNINRLGLKIILKHNNSEIDKMLKEELQGQKAKLKELNLVC